MKKYNLRGAGAVFRYTLAQHYKTLSVRILLLILVGLALTVFPLLTSIYGGKEETGSTEITTLYLRNETPFPIDAADIQADERYAELEIEETDKDNTALAELLADGKTTAAAVITSDESGMLFTVNGYSGEKSSYSTGDLDTLDSLLSDALRSAMMRSLNITDEQSDLLKSMTFSQVSTVADYQAGTNVISADTHVMVNMVYCYAVVILSALAMSYIFQQCMEEKVSKLVETLLVSVSPMGLLVGKVLAVTTMLFIGIALVAAALVGSYQMAGLIGDTAFIGEYFKNTMGIDFSALQISAGTVIMVVVCMFIAYSIIAFFSAMVGSCCSKSEDTQQASLAVMLFIMAGYMLGALLPMADSDAMNYFCALFPLTSIFNALPAYVCGKIPLGIFVPALVIQLATSYFLAMGAGAVYRMMLFYRGGIPKPAQLLRMLKDSRTAGKEAKDGK